MKLTNYICDNLSRGITLALNEYIKTQGIASRNVSATYDVSSLDEPTLEISCMGSDILCIWLETLGITYKHKNDYLVILDNDQAIKLITLLRIQGKIKLLNL